MQQRLSNDLGNEITSKSPTKGLLDIRLVSAFSSPIALIEETGSEAAGLELDKSGMQTV